MVLEDGNLRKDISTNVILFILDTLELMFYTRSWHGKAKHLAVFPFIAESLAVLDPTPTLPRPSPPFHFGDALRSPFSRNENGEGEKENMGAPKGNTNALKHGLYAKHFSPAEQAQLKKMSPEDYRHELFMMRVAVKNLFEIQKRLYEKTEERLNSAEPLDVDGLTKISNSLSLAITALNATARTYALFTGTDTSLSDSFEQTLNSLTIFQTDTYLIETNEQAENVTEVLTLPEKPEE